MENDDYITLDDMEYIWEYSGRQEARKDFKQYQDGEITKKQLTDYCWVARQYAALGDLEGQVKGTAYLYEMEELGFIKNLHIVD